MVEEGNPSSVSDAGVGAEVAYAGLRGACLNVLINISGMDDDEDFVEKAKDEVGKLLSSSKILHQMIFAKTVEIIGK
jgi:glutamate formiminotransferase/formiminotetrahydrofolate cyclodeaminase